MKNKSKSEKLIMWVFFAIFALYAISLIFPFGWTLVNSFKSKNEFFHNLWGLPEDWYFSNWADSFAMQAYGLTIPQLYLNSIIFTIGSTLLSLMSCSATAYVLTKYNFKGKNTFYAAALVIMMIPTMGSMAALYRFYNDAGLINTYTGIFIMSLGGFGTGFLLLYGYYKNLSWSYAEAAMIDGAGHYAVYFRIMLPMAIPALSAVGVLQAIGVWNDYFTVYMYAPEKATIAVGLQRINQEMSSMMDYPKLFAAMMFSVIPVIAIFAAMQKTIMKNTAIGGLKG